METVEKVGDPRKSTSAKLGFDTIQSSDVIGFLIPLVLVKPCYIEDICGRCIMAAYCCGYIFGYDIDH
jgi:hypothetical protein